MPIESIVGRQLFDCNGNPTVEVEVVTEIGSFRALVPSSSAISEFESVELRDGEEQFHGKSVYKAVDHINNVLGPEIIRSKLEVTKQSQIDKIMMAIDSTENKSRLGSNAIMGISMAICKAGAARRCVPLYKHIADLARNKNIMLPVPAFNLINGGFRTENKLALKEFMVMPTGAESFTHAMQMGTEIYHRLRIIICNKYGAKYTSVCSEGGFAPPLNNGNEALDLILEAIDQAGYKGKIDIAIDSAASEFFNEGMYDIDFKNPKSEKPNWISPGELERVYFELINIYPIVSIEDPFSKGDWDSWSNFTAKTDIQVVGDDLTDTNPKRIAKGIKRKACNCLLLNYNQIGTVTEALKCYLLAKKYGWGIMVSHRFGETEDTFVADLCVGLSAGQFKAGAPCRTERVGKYNQILRIEQELGRRTQYAGKCFRHPWVE